MRDTKPEIYQIQKGIMLKMTAKERIQQGYDMIDFAYGIVCKRIKRKNPDTRYLASGVFNELYKNDFNKNELKAITEHLNNVE